LSSPPFKPDPIKPTCMLTPSTGATVPCCLPGSRTFQVQTDHQAKARCGADTVRFPGRLARRRTRHIRVQSKVYVVEKQHPLSRQDSKTLLDSIPTNPVCGSRRSSPRCSTASPVWRGAKTQSRRFTIIAALRLHEKGGKERNMPVHHLLKPDIGRIYCARRPSERPYTRV